jgi:hypothetical protein
MWIVIKTPKLKHKKVHNINASRYNFFKSLTVIMKGNHSQ